MRYVLHKSKKEKCNLSSEAEAVDVQCQDFVGTHVTNQKYTGHASDCPGSTTMAFIHIVAS